jgi:epoxyqueuosine reductase
MSSLTAEGTEFVKCAARAGSIADRAVSLGFERCGIVKVEKMKPYGEKLASRIRRFPESAPILGKLSAFADLASGFPWARSVVICSWHNGAYLMPGNLRGLIGKSYMFDMRRCENSAGHRANAALESYMTDELGMRTASSLDYGITSCRWAALSAGIGTVRKNNFFYGDHGSSYSLSAFLIDEELEYIHEPKHKPCPDNCGLCARSCPTGALAGAYAMNAFSCVSFMTARVQGSSAFEARRSEIGGWIYGCDVCQDACPFNRGTPPGDAEFPGVNALAREISLEKIVSMSYGFLRDVMSKKFWYIGPDDAWMWKRNALNAMKNIGHERYGASIEIALHDEDARVRKIAQREVSSSAYSG